MDGSRAALSRWGAIILAVVLGGCGAPLSPSGSSDGTPATSVFTDESFSSPPTEPATTTASGASAGSQTPAIRLPHLPVGGSAHTDTEDPRRQCVDVRWAITTNAGPDIRQGYAVEITGAVFSGKGFTAVKAGCASSRPNCLGHILRAGTVECDLAVRALPEADPQATVTVGLKGIVYCPQSVGADGCRRFADAVAKEPQITIPLDPAPDHDTATGSANPTETTTSTATSTVSGAGTGTSTGG